MGIAPRVVTVALAAMAAMACRFSSTYRVSITAKVALEEMEAVEEARLALASISRRQSRAAFRWIEQQSPTTPHSQELAVRRVLVATAGVPVCRCLPACVAAGS